MPMFGNKYASNPKVGMRHQQMDAPAAPAVPDQATMGDDVPDYDAKGVTVTQNPDGGVHVHVHHTDEHSDHPDMESGMGHAAMNMSDEPEPVDDMQEETAEMPAADNKMAPFKAKRADSGGM